jgi:hypothetical protein
MLTIFYIATTFRSGHTPWGLLSLHSISVFLEDFQRFGASQRPKIRVVTPNDKLDAVDN